MSLQINDLREHEKKLNEIIESAEKEREAIRVLINGIQLRGGASPSLSPVISGKKLTVKGALKTAIENSGDIWFTVREITDRIVELGLTQREAAKLRPTVANYLKAMYDRNLVERKNVGSEDSPAYSYRKLEDAKLL